MYVFLSVGILKATHFCMGREASVVFFSSEAKKCACSLYAGEKNDCCDEQHEVLRIDDEQKVITTMSLPVPVWKLERIFTEQYIAIAETIRSIERPLPDIGFPLSVPLWKSHCSLVFYDDERA
jgi:hypothetical protein